MVVGRVIEKHVQSQPSQGTEYVADQLIIHSFQPFQNVLCVW